MNDLDAAEQKEFDDNIAWLKAAGPDDWHRVALDFNWGQYPYLMDWIVRQDDCDLATALTIFWLGEPNSWVEELQVRNEISSGFSELNRSICEYIAARVAVGGYARSKIRFEPDVCTKQDYLELAEQEKDFINPNIRTHRNLIRKRRGRVIINDKDFYERYPERFHCTFLLESFESTPRTIRLMAEIRKIEDKMRSFFPAWLRS